MGLVRVKRGLRLTSLTRVRVGGWWSGQLGLGVRALTRIQVVRVRVRAVRAIRVRVRGATFHHNPSGLGLHHLHDIIFS